MVIVTPFSNVWKVRHTKNSVTSWKNTHDLAERVWREISSDKTRARLDDTIENYKITHTYAKIRRIPVIYFVEHRSFNAISGFVTYVLYIPWMAATSWRLGLSATVGIIVGEPRTKKII